MILNPEQQRIVDAQGFGLAVIAGAGCGKTSTLREKVRAHLQRFPEDRILAVSFTEKSAQELQEKLFSLFENELDPFAKHWIKTIHGFCDALLREFPIEAGLTGSETVGSAFEIEKLWSATLDSFWTARLPNELEAALLRTLERFDFSKLRELLEEIRRRPEILKALAEKSDLPARELHMLGEYCVNDFRARKKTAQLLEFDDLEIGARRCLDDPKVRQKIRQRFGLILVDEFQDTNRIQYEILTLITQENFSNLCVVGDPKQAIYRFRGANYALFYQLCQEVDAATQKIAGRSALFTLSENYRSQPALIEFINQVCAPLFLASGAYEPLYPALAEHPEAARSAIEVSESLPKEAFVRLKNHLRARVDRGESLADSVLLLERIDVEGVQSGIKILKEAGISVILSSKMAFYRDPRVRELIAALKFLAFPSFEIEGLSFLRSPLFRVPETWIDEIKAQKKPLVEIFTLPAFKKTFAGWADFLNSSVRHDPHAFFNFLTVYSQIPAEYRVVIPALREKIRALQEKGFLGFAAIMALESESRAPREAEQMVAPETAQTLRILTIHKAKGLEFDQVYLLCPYSAKDVHFHGSAGVMWDAEIGLYIRPLTAAGKFLPKDEDPTFQALLDRERTKDIEDRKRLLYVALTRARHRLHLFLERDPEKSASRSLNQYFSQALFSVIDGGSFARVPDTEREAGLSEFAAKASPDDRLLQWTRPVIWTQPRVSVSEILKRLSGPLGKNASSEAELLEKIPRVGDPRGQGIRLHEQLAQEKISEIAETPWREFLMAAPEFDRTQIERAWTERAFEFALGGEMVVGAFDRVVRYRDGRTELIDFKWTGRPTDESLLRARYTLQIQIYRAAVAAMGGVLPAEISAKLVHFFPGGVRSIRIPHETLDWHSVFKPLH